MRCRIVCLSRFLLSREKLSLTICLCVNKSDDYHSFARINTRLLNAPSALRNVPVRIYIPSSPAGAEDFTPGSYKVMQTLVSPRLANSKSPLYSTMHICVVISQADLFVKRSRKTRSSANSRRCPQSYSAYIVPQQQRSRSGERDPPRRVCTVQGAARGPDARSSVSRRVVVFDSGFVVNLLLVYVSWGATVMMSSSSRNTMMNNSKHAFMPKSHCI
jgi:hypothetical protein